MRRSLLIGLAALAGACVFPSDEPTGVELSWRFFEVNTADGTEAVRIRTCAGAGFDRMVLDIAEVDNAARSGNFDYACDVGFQTPSEFRTEASDAFIELRPASYILGVDAIASGGGRQDFVEFEIGVQERGLTIEGLDLALSTATWTLELVNTEDCGEVSFALHYANAGENLALPDVDDDGKALDVLYRDVLATDRGLSLAGTASPCSADLTGAHVVELVDQGPYRLAIVLDGVSCTANVDIHPGEVTTVLDLATLSCDG